MVDINVGQIAEALNGKMDRNLANTDAIGQAILDGKVEVEALLEQNGYAKFTWKNGTNINKLLVQWGYTTVANVSLPTAYSNNIYSLLIRPTIINNPAMSGDTFKNSQQTATTFSVNINALQVSSSWFTIGI